MKKVLALLLALLFAFSALSALAENEEPPLAQLYDPDKFVEAFEQAQKEGLIPSNYVISEEDRERLQYDLIMGGTIAMYKIDDPEILKDFTYATVYFERYTDTGMMITGLTWPHAVRYHVYSGDSKIDAQGEWISFTVSFANLLTRLTGDENLLDWMLTKALEYYDIFEKQGKTSFNEIYEGEEYQVEMRSGIQFSFSFTFTPY